MPAQVENVLSLSAFVTHETAPASPLDFMQGGPHYGCNDGTRRAELRSKRHVHAEIRSRGQARAHHRVQRVGRVYQSIGNADERATAHRRIRRQLAVDLS